ncbi:MAG TPA: NAD-dependent epimerase/dehydratase family protein [Nitrospiraceae bacterium]|jgi:UDP-glucose 4-epimerase|nr:NAD-dependent epimerase/dehydratase family protein [Nitrospiraceae bacterium]
MVPDLKGKKVLVTGGAGFIGSHTVDVLIAKGARVVVVDDLSTGLEQNLNPRATFYKLNMADPALEEILDKERPEIIYHFAFFVLVPKSVENPLRDLDVVAGTLRMLQKAKEIGVKRIVLASSGFLYGNTTDLPATEECPIDPVSPYVVSKHALEEYLRFYHKAYRTPYTILRYATTYGPGQVTGAMADYTRKLSNGEQAEIWGDGNKTRDYVFIEDVVRANLLALTVSPDHANPVFNIGTGIETTLNTVYRKIAELLGVTAQPIYHPDRPGEQIRYCLDYSKSKREIGWEPRWSLAEGLGLTVKAYREPQGVAAR